MEGKLVVLVVIRYSLVQILLSRFNLCLNHNKCAFSVEVLHIPVVKFVLTKV